MNWVAQIGFALALLTATLAAYQPAWRGGVLWDDAAHLTRPELRSAGGLWRIWFEPGATQQYYPLTHSAFWLQSKLWGDNTLGYHLVNIALHVAVALLLVMILCRLGVPGAYLAGVIFALHPVHVESVAWITELKNLLSGLLYLGAALVYLYFDARRWKLLYAVALGLFVLGLLSKTVTATLPAALLVVFWWQRGRLGWRRDVLPLAPFFILGAAGGLFTAWVEHTLIGAEGSEFQFTLIERCLIAGRVIWFYLGKLLWPANLIFIYPRWGISQKIWWQYLFPLCVIGLLLGLWLLRKRSRAPLAAALLFCGTLFPVLGFFNVYPFRYSFVADHFQYLASLAIISLVAAAVAHLIARSPLKPGPTSIAVGLLLAGVLGTLSWRQSRQYVDVENLYRQTIIRNPACWMAHCNLGIVLADLGQNDAAIQHYRKALRLKPDYAEAYSSLGVLLVDRGQYDEAIRCFRAALQLQPGYAEVYNNWGFALESIGRVDEAAAHYREALRLHPDYSKAHYNLGNALQKLGQPEAAIQHYQEALRLNPDYALAHNNLGTVLQTIGQSDRAIQHFRAALRLRPNFELAHNNLGTSLSSLGQTDQAIQQYQEALRLKPNYAMAHDNLGTLLMKQGELQEAAAHFRAALAIQPDNASARSNLSLVEASLHQGPKTPMAPRVR